jgi:hypothetical protein
MDDQIALHGAFYRQVGRLSALQDRVDRRRAPPPGIRMIGRSGHQPPSRCKGARHGPRWQVVRHRQLGRVWRPEEGWDAPGSCPLVEHGGQHNCNTERSIEQQRLNQVIQYWYPLWVHTRGGRGEAGYARYQWPVYGFGNLAASTAMESATQGSAGRTDCGCRAQRQVGPVTLSLR